MNYLFKLAKNYNSKYLNRFKDHKRYAMMLCFMLEPRKILLDHLVKMHDQYLTDIYRNAKNTYKKKYRGFRKNQKKDIDVLFNSTHILLNWLPETISTYQ